MTPYLCEWLQYQAHTQMSCTMQCEGLKADSSCSCQNRRRARTHRSRGDRSRAAGTLPPPTALLPPPSTSAASVQPFAADVTPAAGEVPRAGDAALSTASCAVMALHQHTANFASQSCTRHCLRAAADAQRCGARGCSCADLSSRCMCRQCRQADALEAMQAPPSAVHAAALPTDADNALREAPVTWHDCCTVMITYIVPERAAVRVEALQRRPVVAGSDLEEFVTFIRHSLPPATPAYMRFPIGLNKSRHTLFELSSTRRRSL